MPMGDEIESRSDSRSEFEAESRTRNRIKSTHLVTSRRPCPTFVWVGCCTHEAGMLSDELILQNLMTAFKLTCQTIGLMYVLKANINTGPFLKTILLSPLRCDSFSARWCRLTCCIFDNNWPTIWTDSCYAVKIRHTISLVYFLCDLSWCVQFPISH